MMANQSPYDLWAAAIAEKWLPDLKDAFAEELAQIFRAVGEASAIEMRARCRDHLTRMAGESDETTLAIGLTVASDEIGALPIIVGRQADKESR